MSDLLNRIRRQMAQQHRISEAQSLSALTAQANLTPRQISSIKQTAAGLSIRVRARQEGLDALLIEYCLSNHEGQLLMGLAEALQRVKNNETRDRLIADKLLAGDWVSHLAASPSFLVNSLSLGLVLAKWILSHSVVQLGAGKLVWFKCLFGLIVRPLVRWCTLGGIKFMAGHYVMGQGIKSAHRRSQRAAEYCYSYDMLGEGARTELDAQQYYEAYAQAIHSLGQINLDEQGATLGISVKLSALSPRYQFSHRETVVPIITEKLKRLCLLAQSYDLPLVVDAEEANRLEMSLDIIASIAMDDDLSEWQGFGLAVQAYQKRAPLLIDWIHELAGITHKKLLVRLVKGAYWDSEIKWAQVEGLVDYPVFTKKAATDLCYQICAEKLLNYRARLFPQFATHNALTVATILAMDDEDVSMRRQGYEFQRLHGMGDVLYQTVMSVEGISCRVYCPVGRHQDLLAYLVRRLLENGANSSFVNQIGDRSIPLEDILRLPSEVLDDPMVKRGICLPPQLYNAELYRHQGLTEARVNAAGLDLSAEVDVKTLMSSLISEWHHRRDEHVEAGRTSAVPVLNPADQTECIGYIHYDTSQEIALKLEIVCESFETWSQTDVKSRCELARALADEMERELPGLMALCTQEAGKTIPDSLAEVREAVDFCRYYANQAEDANAENATQALGVVFCICPWNFPLAIFLGQIIAALVTGNTVIAKPAEQTSLIALKVQALMLRSGFPASVLQLVLGPGAPIGEQLIDDRSIKAVIFTGSIDTAFWLNKRLSNRPDAPIPLIAETGGQNAMIVDMTALPEQVVDDVINAGFHSAGQRCSALRLLFVQEQMFDTLVPMIKGAMANLQLGDPKRLSTDVGPIIDNAALTKLQQHIARMKAAGLDCYSAANHCLPDSGHFIAPTLIELPNLDLIKQEVFGPVVHLISYKIEALDQLVDQINALGFGLTFGIHSRNNAQIDYLSSKIEVGNVYVNRAMTGAVVGAQPFGGRALSGTGPKAGGPEYLGRLVNSKVSSQDDNLFDEIAPGGTDVQATHTGSFILSLQKEPEAFVGRLGKLSLSLAVWRQTALNDRIQLLRTAALSINSEVLEQEDMCYLERLFIQARELLETETLLPGPAGERNILKLEPRGIVAILAPTKVQSMIVICLANLLAGNAILLVAPSDQRRVLKQLVAALGDCLLTHLIQVFDESACKSICHANIKALMMPIDWQDKPQILSWLSENKYQLIGVIDTSERDNLLNRLCLEKSISTNTAAVGGDVALLSL